MRVAADAEAGGEQIFGSVLAQLAAQFAGEDSARVGQVDGRKNFVWTAELTVEPAQRDLAEAALARLSKAAALEEKVPRFVVKGRQKAELQEAGIGVYQQVFTGLKAPQLVVHRFDER